MDIFKLTEHFNDKYEDLLKSMFRGVDFKGRITVEKESLMLNKDSLDSFNIRKGNRLEEFNILFDGIFMCSFNEESNPVQVDKEFLEGFLGAYQREDIYLSPGLKEQKDREREQQKIMEEAKKKADRDADLSSLSADEREIAEEVLDEVTKEKGHATA